MNRINNTGANEAESVREFRRAEQTRPAAADTSRPTAASGKPAPAESDKVSVSETAASVGRLVDRVRETAEVRQERIDALRREVASGSYRPDADAIADAILKEES
jgi:flagellar biosynthesis anti-sigma factor FlgM